MICGALRDLVPFGPFKKREKHPWKSVNFSKESTLLKLTLLHGCFSRFLNGTNGTKLRNASHIEFVEEMKQMKLLKFVHETEEVKEQL